MSLVSCPACQRENRDDARFCDSCGLLKQLAESSGDIDFGEKREVALKGSEVRRLYEVVWNPAA